MDSCEWIRTAGRACAGERSGRETTWPKAPDFEPKVKRVIPFVHARRAFEHRYIRPDLIQEHGKPVPFKRGLTLPKMVPWVDEIAVGVPAAQPKRNPVSSLSPNVASWADYLCVIRSMVGDGVDHGAALLQLHTGVFSFKRPSMGAWILCGLGSENQDLPGFITIKPSVQKSPRSSLTADPCCSAANCSTDG
jgi:hypothetical protein